jgi:hypothetical protein
MNYGLPNTEWRIHTALAKPAAGLIPLCALLEYWADRGQRAEDRIAMDAWNQHLPDPALSAGKAIEDPKYSLRMTRVAREQRTELD